MTESRTYQLGFWAVLIMFAAQSAFYSLWALPTLYKIIKGDTEYIEWLEFTNDGCNELKVQFNDMYEEYHYLAPELNSQHYKLRMRVR